MGHRNESRHPYEWVMGHVWISHVTPMHESCDTWMSDVTHMNESCDTHEWVLWHIWMSHVTQMNESCHVCSLMRGVYPWTCDMSRIQLRHVTHINTTRLLYRWVISYVRVHHVTPMNESCHTYECVTSHIWMNQVTQMLLEGNPARARSHTNESLHPCERVISPICMSHVTHRKTSCHIYEWVMSRMCTLKGTQRWQRAHKVMWASHESTKSCEEVTRHEWFVTSGSWSGASHVSESCTKSCERVTRYTHRLYMNEASLNDTPHWMTCVHVTWMRRVIQWGTSWMRPHSCRMWPHWMTCLIECWWKDFLWNRTRLIEWLWGGFG